MAESCFSHPTIRSLSLIHSSYNLSWLSSHHHTDAYAYTRRQIERCCPSFLSFSLFIIVFRSHLSTSPVPPGERSVDTDTFARVQSEHCYVPLQMCLYPRFFPPVSSCTASVPVLRVLLISPITTIPFFRTQYILLSSVLFSGISQFLVTSDDSVSFSTRHYISFFVRPRQSEPVDQLSRYAY